MEGSGAHAEFQLEYRFCELGDYLTWKARCYRACHCNHIRAGGEWARLRMSTSIGFSASNLDLVLTPQGQVGGQQIFVATHFVRVYSDQLIPFSVNRDNAQTEGHAFICISGYLIDI